MNRPARPACWLGLWVFIFGLMARNANAEPPTGSTKQDGNKAVSALPAPLGALHIPLEEIPLDYRVLVRRIVDQPTLSASGMPEEFIGRPGLYEWLLQHPDRAAQAWRRLGAPCLEIVDRGNGTFGCTDARGTDIHWQTVFQSPSLRVWFGECRARPSLLLPTMLIRAVAILQYDMQSEPNGKTVIRQQAHLYLHTDSRTANLLLRLVGPTAPRLTEECVSQLQMFYSTLVRFAEKYPERTEWLLLGTAADRPALKKKG